MKPALAVLLTMCVGLTGCTLTDSQSGYGHGGPYDQGYADNSGYAVPASPGYVQPGYAQPGYAQPGYGQPSYGQPGGYYPPQGGYADGRYRDDRTYRDRQAYPSQQEYRTQRPGNPQLAPGVNVEAVQAGDQLVAALDRYLQSINRYNDAQVNNMKSIITQMRSAADTWRHSARNAGPRQTLQVAAQDLLNRFNAANQLYAQMVATNPRWQSDNFGRVATATERVVYSVR